MRVGDEQIPHTGSYLALQRPHRLAFTWESPFSSDDSIVTLVFTEIDVRSTRIDLQHVRFINAEARDNHEGGWGNILRELAPV
jgi:uncharacterized protein YndB with AHSA1/START domain